MSGVVDRTDFKDMRALGQIRRRREIGRRRPRPAIQTVLIAGDAADVRRLGPGERHIRLVRDAVIVRPTRVRGDSHVEGPVREGHVDRELSRKDVVPVEMLPGLFRRTLAWGAKAMITEFTAVEGVFIPMHSHSQEQVGYVLKGQVEFVADGETFIADVGDSYALPGGVEHSARFLAPSTLIEVFSPVREEYQ